MSIEKVCVVKMTVEEAFFGTSVVDINQEGMHVKNDCLTGEFLGHPSAYGRTLFQIYVHNPATSMCDKRL